MSNTRGSEAASRRSTNTAGDGEDAHVVHLFPSDRAGFAARAGSEVGRDADEKAGEMLPGDRQAEFETLVRRQLELLGEDPERDGLLKTPSRVAKSMAWLTRGYEMNVRDVIGDALFEVDSEGMVMVRDIELYSLCEHHMLPFYGKAHIAYIPNGRVVGLSKLARVVEVFARRLQVQERLTEQVALALEETLQPKGVGRRHRGRPPVHDDARRREAELDDGHQRAARRVKDDGRTRDEFPTPGPRVGDPGDGDGAATITDCGARPLAGRLALVTGASRGIGLATARLLAAAGAHVALLARSADVLAQQADAIAREHAVRTLALPCDVRDVASVQSALARARDAFGGTPDLLVNNAGAFALAPIASTDPDAFAATLEAT
jgi:GTP cyclohydrolase I